MMAHAGANVSATSTRICRTTWARSATSSCPTTSIPRLRARRRSAARSGTPARRRSRPMRAASPMCVRSVRPGARRVPHGKARGSHASRRSARRCRAPTTGSSSPPRRRVRLPLVRLIHSFQRMRSAVRCGDRGRRGDRQGCGRQGDMARAGDRAAASPRGTIMGKNASDFRRRQFGQATSSQSLCRRVRDLSDRKLGQSHFTLNALSLRGASNWWRTGAASRVNRSDVHRA